MINPPFVRQPIPDLYKRNMGSKFVVHFRRRFTENSISAGLYHDDCLPFAGIYSAIHWLKECHQRHLEGKLNWKFEHWELEEIV